MRRLQAKGAKEYDMIIYHMVLHVNHMIIISAYRCMCVLRLEDEHVWKMMLMMKIDIQTDKPSSILGSRRISRDIPTFIQTSIL